MGRPQAGTPARAAQAGLDVVQLGRRGLGAEVISCGRRGRVLVGAGGRQWSRSCRCRGRVVPKHDEAFSMTVRGRDDDALPVGDGNHRAEPQADGAQRRQGGGDGPFFAQAVSLGLWEG